MAMIKPVATEAAIGLLFQCLNTKRVYELCLAAHERGVSIPEYVGEVVYNEALIRGAKTVLWTQVEMKKI